MRFNNQKFHWCYPHERREDGAIVIGGTKFIKASEFKTSPQWCPKRKEVSSDAAE
jgi:hypothetical protein